MAMGVTAQFSFLPLFLLEEESLVCLRSAGKVTTTNDGRKAVLPDGENWIVPPPSTLAQSKERKGSNFAAQCSGAIVLQPQRTTRAYKLKIWL